MTEFMRGIFVTDIETAGHPDRVGFVAGPSEPVTWEDAPQSYQRKTSNDRAIEWAEAKNADLQAKHDVALLNMGLDVDLCRIVALGWKVAIAHDDTLSVAAIGADDEEEEYDALCSFWGAWMRFGSRMCGFNIIGFDLPIIMRRSWALGIEFAPIRLRRYSTEPVIDLMQEFYGWGQYPGPKYRGLKTIAKMYGIPVPKEGVDGSQVAEMSKEEREEYCLSDVEVTWELARRLHGVYWR